MPEGFKIADAYVEIHADIDRALRDGVKDADIDRHGRRMGDQLGSGIGRGLSNSLLGGGGGGGIVSSALGTVASDAVGGLTRDINGQLRNARGQFASEAEKLAAGIADPIKKTLGGRSGGVISTTLATMATKFAVVTVAGAGLGVILKELSGVAGLLPATLFAGGLAMGTLAVATSGFGDAIKNVGDPEKFAESVGKLAPSAREAAFAVRDLMPAFRDLKVAVQDRFFAGLGPMFSGLARTYLPMVQTAMSSVAGSINGMLTGVGADFQSVRRQADMRLILDASAASVGNLVAMVRPLVSAFIDVAAVGAPMLQSLTAQAGPLAERFAAFVAKARETGQLGTWIQSGLQAFRDLWTIGSLLFGTVTNLVAAFGGPSSLLGVLTLVAGVLNTVSGFIRDNITWLGPLAAAIGVVVAGVKAWGIAQAVTNAILMINPFVAIAAAVIAVVLLIITHWDQIKAYLSATWEWIKSTASAAWNWITTTIGAAVAAVRNVITTTWTAITGFLTGVLEGIKSTASNAWNSVKSTASSAWSGIKSAVSSAAEGTRSAVSSAWNAVQSHTSSAFNSARSIAASAWNSMSSTTRSVVGSIISDMAAMPGRIAGALGNLGSLLVGAGRSLIMGLWNGIQAAFSWVKSQVSGLMSGLRNLFPFSPAKEGPFSGKGYTSFSGAAMMRDWAKGMTSQAGTVQRAVEGILADAQPSFGIPALTGAGGGGTVPVTSSTSTTIASLTLQIAGNLDPTNPTAYRQAIENLTAAIRDVERSNR